MANFKSHSIHVAAFAGITFYLPPGTTCPSLASMSAFSDQCPGLSVGFEQVHIVSRQRG